MHYITKGFDTRAILAVLTAHHCNLYLFGAESDAYNAWKYFFYMFFSIKSDFFFFFVW